MTNTDLLNAVILAKGVKITRIKEVLGVSFPTVRRRLTGKNEFLQSEIVKLRDLLSLTDDEVREIFLR